MKNIALGEMIERAAMNFGFDSCGIIPISFMDSFQTNLQKRVEAVPSTVPFYNCTPAKEKFSWGESIVICTYNFGKYRYPREQRGRYGKAFLLGPKKDKPYGYDIPGFEDWFESQGIRFHQGDFGSLRHAAEKAGLGITRKNNFFYTASGSYVDLVGFVIDQECELIHDNNIKPCSDRCDLCQKACKTHSLSASYTMNPFLCISFLTSFGKGNVPPELKEEMYEQWICGCDNCQDACPYNLKHDWDEGEIYSDLEEIAPLLVPEKVVAAMDDFLKEQVIPRLSDHLQPEDTEVLRKNARRAIRNAKGDS